MSEISKAVGFALLNISDGVNISKAVGFAVISTERNIVITKVVGFAVLDGEGSEGSVGTRPFVFIL